MPVRREYGDSVERGLCGACSLSTPFLCSASRKRGRAIDVGVKVSGANLGLLAPFPAFRMLCDGRIERVSRAGVSAIQIIRDGIIRDQFAGRISEDEIKP